MASGDGLKSVSTLAPDRHVVNTFLGCCHTFLECGSRLYDDLAGKSSEDIYRYFVERQAERARGKTDHS